MIKKANVRVSGSPFHPITALSALSYSQGNVLIGQLPASFVPQDEKKFSDEMNLLQLKRPRVSGINASSPNGRR